MYRQLRSAKILAIRKKRKNRKAGRKRPQEGRSYWSYLIGKFYNLPTLQVVAITVFFITGAAVLDEPGLTLIQRLSPLQFLRVAFEKAESIAIVSAIVVYLKETPDRKIRQQSELFNIFESSAKFPNTQVRALVLEKLNSEGVPLGLYDFSDIESLPNVQFPDANLCKANFQNVKMKKANLQNALLCQTIFKSSNLHTANLQNANLWKANLEEAILNNADLSHANLSECSAFGANLQGAKLNGAYLRSANLYEAKLQKADLSGADLQNVDLKGANLRDANLEGVHLKDVFFDDTIMPNGLKWNKPIRDIW